MKKAKSATFKNKAAHSKLVTAKSGSIERKAIIGADAKKDGIGASKIKNAAKKAAPKKKTAAKKAAPRKNSSDSGKGIATDRDKPVRPNKK